MPSSGDKKRQAKKKNNHTGRYRPLPHTKMRTLPSGRHANNGQTAYRHPCNCSKKKGHDTDDACISLFQQHRLFRAFPKSHRGKHIDYGNVMKNDARSDHQLGKGHGPECKQGQLGNHMDSSQAQPGDKNTNKTQQGRTAKSQSAQDHVGFVVRNTPGERQQPSFMESRNRIKNPISLVVGKKHHEQGHRHG